MGLLSGLSIKSKLTLITVVTAVVSLALACAAFLAFDMAVTRQEMVRALSAMADVAGSNSTAALVFEDSSAATEALTAFRSDYRVDAACIYAADGKRLATYFRKDELPLPRPSELRPGQYRSTTDHLELSRPIVLNGKTVGAVYVRASLAQLRERLWDGLGVLGVVTAVGCLFAYVLARSLRRLITRPILHLTQTARAVSTEKNYGVRARKSTNDELGLLIDCFNGMLEQIQFRDAELQAHRSHLEEEVAHRTDELRRVNSQLLSAKERAEAASRAKSAFLANMSHEIRTPMTAIIGYADMVLEPDQNASDRQDCIQVIRRNARHLMELISDILDISKIEAEKMSLEKIVCELPQVIADVVSLMRPRALEKDLDFKLTFDGALPQQVLTDPQRLKQVLVNVLANAVKFTARGQVELCVRWQRPQLAGQESVLRFDIRDTGIGMTDEQTMRLFQPFNQVDDSLTRRFGGTGLGLTISQRLARMLGGDITAESRAGVGSVFHVRIAAPVPEGSSILEQPAEAFLNSPTGESRQRQINLRGRVLLAEDGMDNQRLISTHLRKAGLDVVVVENGKLAVQAVRSQQIDLVLMDMQMPVMDGYSATSELRRLGMKLPIIALTAHAMSDDRGKCIRAGCTDYLTKPVDRDCLLGTVAYYLQKTRQRSAATSAKDGGQQPPSADTTEQCRVDDAAVRRTLAPAPAPQAPANPALPQPMAPASAAGGAEPASAGGAEPSLPSSYGDDAEMRQVIEQFVSGLPRQVHALVDLLRIRDLENLRRAVHQLKGAGGGYGFQAITDAAAWAEGHIKNSEPIDTIVADVQSLVALIRRIEGYNRAAEAAEGEQEQGHA